MIKYTLTLNGESDVVGRFANAVVGSVVDGVLDRSVTTDEVKGIVEGTWEVDDEPWATVEVACCLGDEREDAPKGFVVGRNVDVDMVPLR